MKLTPLEHRAERRKRNLMMVDMNLVSLIDIFTILIFFLLANALDVETLPPSKAVRLPESTAEKRPKETVIVVVNQQDILVQGRKVASTPEVLEAPGDLIEPLRAELELQAGRKIVRQENAARGQAVTIMGDKEIPYRLLRKVMFTCARANFSDVSFAVQMKSKA
jgi:biopolymer transport protein ExbD